MPREEIIPEEILNLKEISHWKEFVCGWGAACINITVTYPITKMIFRQMLTGVPISRAFGEMYQEGFFYLYRGMLPPLMQKTLSLSIMFGVYEEVRRPLVDVHKINPYYAKTIAGISAGTAEAILMPFERVQTLLIDATHHKRFKNTFHAFKTVGLGYGIREYYRGLVPILFRNGPSNVLFFTLRDEFQAFINKRNTVVNQSVTEFFCGAVIGAMLSGIFFPLNVLKINMQSRIGGEFESVAKALSQIYHERGGTIRNFYLGVNATMLRSFFCWGIMNSAYIQLKKLFD